MLGLRLLWLVPVTCAALELVARGAIQRAVPDPTAIRNGARYIRDHFRAGDAISAAPAWFDPLMREQLGDLIPLAMAGRSDLAAYRRLWVLGIGDAMPPELGSSNAGSNESRSIQREALRRFGPITVTRYGLPEPRVQVNLVERLQSATVQRSREGDPPSPCRFYRGLPGPGGGLGRGAVPPAERFVCGPGRDQMVAAVVVEDLNLQPRYCVWHPALRGQAITVRYPDVPLGDALVVDAGLYYEHERDGDNAPVTLTVRVSGQVQDQLVHIDGEGFRRLRIPTAHLPSPSPIEFEVSSERTGKPGFCWSANIRSQAP